MTNRTIIQTALRLDKTLLYTIKRTALDRQENGTKPSSVNAIIVQAIEEWCRTHLPPEP